MHVSRASSVPLAGVAPVLHARPKSGTPLAFSGAELAEACGPVMTLRSDRLNGPGWACAVAIPEAKGRIVETATLWDAFQRRGDPSAREQILSSNLRLVRYVARQLARTLPVDTEFDDLVSAGTVGLIKAVETFDPSRGLAFSTFAAPRIRGAILDDLRKRDPVPRSVRRKQRQIASARGVLHGALGRPPRAHETAGELGIDVEILWRWEFDAQEAVHVSLDAPLVIDEPGGATPLDLLVAESGREIEDEVGRKQEFDLLRREITALSERERVVLSLYYFDELKLHEIAGVLKLTASRISQIRSTAVKTLRGKLAALREER